jgi:hypothetical protein
MNPRTTLIATLIGLSACAVGCVQLPTESHGVVDQRPQLSFVVDDANTDASSARVSVDGLDAGTVGNFVQGRAALRVLPGTHVVRVQSASGLVLLEQRIYLADGVSQALIVK